MDPYDLKRTLELTNARTFDDNFSMATVESKYKKPHQIPHV